MCFCYLLNRPSAAHVRHHCWLTDECDLKEYLAKLSGNDSDEEDTEETTTTIDTPGEVDIELSPVRDTASCISPRIQAILKE